MILGPSIDGRYATTCSAEVTGSNTGMSVSSTSGFMSQPTLLLEVKLSRSEARPWFIGPRDIQPTLASAVLHILYLWSLGMPAGVMGNYA